MTDKTKKYSAPRFFRRLLCYALILALLIAAALFILNKWAEKYQSDYEQALAAEIPSPEPAFMEFIESAGAKYWAQLWLADNPGIPETEETVSSYMQELFFNGGTEYYKSNDFSSESPQYIVVKDGNTLADITLALSSDNTWSVSEVRQYITGTCEGSITLPEGCTAYCNGIVLDSSYASETDLFPSDQYSTERVNPVGFEIWTVSGLLNEPELSYDPPASEVLVADGSGNILIQLTASEDSVYLEKAKPFFNNFITFFRCGCVDTTSNADNVQAYTIRDSAAYKDISDISHGVHLSRYYSEYTESSSFGPVIKWADNFISVDVTFSLYAESDGEILDNSGVYRLLLESTDNGWFVVDYALVG